MMLRQLKNTQTPHQGQVILEFALSMIIVLLMIYGCIQILRWTGLDLVERRKQHDQILFRVDVNEDYVNRTDGPMRQLDPYFYDPIDMNAIFVPQ